MGLINPPTFFVPIGTWHGNSVEFRVMQSIDNGDFNGEGVFLGPPFDGIRFDFQGHLSSDGSLRMTRNTDEGLQTSDAGPPSLDGGTLFWGGVTSGAGINGRKQFEFSVDGVIRKGSFPGQWHGQPVNLDIQQTFPNRAFNGIGKFIAGPFQGIQFGYEGTLGGDGSLVITRDTGKGIQTATAGPPELVNVPSNNAFFSWSGNTSGEGIPPGLQLFQLELAKQNN